MELVIKRPESWHCKRTFGIRHNREFVIRPLEIGIIIHVRLQSKKSYYEEFGIRPNQKIEVGNRHNLNS